MAVSTINKEVHEIITIFKAVTIPANSQRAYASLDVPSGYNFLSTLGCASSGWIGHVYPTDFSTTNITLWTSEPASTSPRNVNVWYQCYR